jgi:hypothetical protein
MISKFIADYKREHSCYYCNEDEPIALDFHHIDDKDIEIGAGKQQVSFSKLKQELEKCIVVCANCHRKLHVNLLPQPKLEDT